MIEPNPIAMTMCKIEGIDEPNAFDRTELSIVRYTFLRVIVLKNSAFPNGYRRGIRALIHRDFLTDK